MSLTEARKSCSPVPEPTWVSLSQAKRHGPVSAKNEEGKETQPEAHGGPPPCHERGPGQESTLRHCPILTRGVMHFKPRNAKPHPSKTTTNEQQGGRFDAMCWRRWWQRRVGRSTGRRRATTASAGSTSWRAALPISPRHLHLQRPPPLCHRHSVYARERHRSEEHTSE